jgi:pterin-4a-carbinolamine dehydratase
MDIPEIRGGSDWQRSIEDALDRATVIIPLIGAQWLSLTDEFDQRRIDLEDDWVRREILHAMSRGKQLLPVTIGDVRPLTARALTGDLKPLAKIQALGLRDTSWEPDLDAFANQLSTFGLNRAKTGVQFPKPTIKVAPLTPAAMRKALRSLPEWSVTASLVPDLPHLTRNELFRKFEFRSFREAIRFMCTTSKDIANANHHPRWENIWRTVSVWLATWDVEFQVSELDIALAHQLDAAYEAQMRAPRKKRKKTSN